MKKIDALSNDILNLKIPNNTDALESAVEVMNKDIANVTADIARAKVHQDSQVAGVLIDFIDLLCCVVLCGVVFYFILFCCVIAY